MANLSSAIRDALPEGQFTFEDVVDKIWNNPDFQDLTEKKLRRETAVRLLVMKQKQEIKAVGVQRVSGQAGFNNMNIYQVME